MKQYILQIELKHFRHEYVFDEMGDFVVAKQMAEDIVVILEEEFLDEDTESGISIEEIVPVVE